MPRDTHSTLLQPQFFQILWQYLLDIVGQTYNTIRIQDVMMKGKLREEIQNSKIIYKIVFGLRGYRFDFSKKLPKASLVSERANAS